MTIRRSISLERRLSRETLRHAGSLAVVIFYSGELPGCCELQAKGERVERRGASEALIRDLARGKEPEMPAGADYWRLLDGNGSVVMQGDGHE